MPSSLPKKAVSVLATSCKTTRCFISTYPIRDAVSPKTNKRAYSAALSSSTLPYVPASRIRQAESKTEPIKVKKQKITVLVAEDHDSNFRLIESILRKDYNLIHAWNGQEAVNMFREYDPQLILMDINMPVMNGYEATREIRKYSTQVPIIAVTAFAYASDEQQVMENGFDAYMAKPINANQLRTQISAILKQHIIFM